MLIYQRFIDFFIGGDTRIRTGDQSFADSCLTTWLYRRIYGAGNGAQTRDLCLGKAALYQLSYSRMFLLLSLDYMLKHLK